MMADAPRLTKEETNLYRYWQALVAAAEGKPPSVKDFLPLGDLSDIAVEMFDARSKSGVTGLKQYVAALSNLKDQKSRRLVTILSSATLEQAEIALLAPQKVGILLSDVIPEDIKWLWEPRLALGKMTMLDGDPGLGKSIITLDIASRVSSGLVMPDGKLGIQGGVVLISPEDGLADTIQPRLARVGADLTKIVSIGSVPTTDPETGFTYNRPFTLPDDLAMLDAAIKRVSAKLVIIDPVMAIVGGKSNTYKDNEVRSLLAPVQMLIEKAEASCILVRHMTKQGGDNAIYRGGGSIAFIGLARTGLMLVKDPDDESKGIFAHIKTNIEEKGAFLSYSITNDKAQGDGRAYIVWHGESTLSIKELMGISATNKAGPGRHDILRILMERAPEALSPQDIQKELPEMSIDNVRMTLGRMVKDGQIEKSARGSYCVKQNEHST